MSQQRFITREKLREWFLRYAPSEGLAIVLSLALGHGTMALTGNAVLTAFVATQGDNLGYYGMMAFREIRGSSRRTGTYSVRLFLRDLRNLSFEFGVPEILATFVIFPALMYYFPIWLGSLTLGIILATIVGATIFYLQAIVLYEIRKVIFPES